MSRVCNLQVSQIPVPALILVTLFAASCSHRSEQRLLQRFFDSSRLGDQTALGAMATVIFEPMADGVVTAFTIVSVDPEERQPLNADASAGRIAALSLALREPPGVVRREGEMISEHVKVSASVKRPDGQTVQKTVSVILARVTVRRPREVDGVWVVTGFSSYGR